MNSMEIRKLPAFTSDINVRSYLSSVLVLPHPVKKLTDELRLGKDLA